MMSDLIERQKAIDAIEDEWNGCTGEYPASEIINDTCQRITDLPSAEPQIIRCKDCRYYKQFGKSEWGDCLALSRICKSIDFCSWGARMDSEQILSEADNDTAYGGLMSAT